MVIKGDQRLGDFSFKLRFSAKTVVYWLSWPFLSSQSHHVRWSGDHHVTSVAKSWFQYIALGFVVLDASPPPPDRQMGEQDLWEEVSVCGGEGGCVGVCVCIYLCVCGALHLCASLFSLCSTCYEPQSCCFSSAVFNTQCGTTTTAYAERSALRSWTENRRSGQLCGLLNH